MEMVKGTLELRSQSTEGSASLNGIIRTQNAPATGSSLVIASSGGNATDSTLGGTGRVELGISPASLGMPEEIELRGSEVASGIAPLMTFAPTIRVIDNGVPALPLPESQPLL